MQHYAVIGNPVRHSKSPFIHQLFAEQTGIHLSYTTLEVEPLNFTKTILNFSGQGLNVTQPFKQQAYALMDELSPRALLAGAVNTIKYLPDGSRYGDNTDGAGLVKDLKVNKQLILQDKHILILGAGGAVYGILAPILNESPARVIIANRTEAKAVELVHRFKEHTNLMASSFSELKKYTVDLIINAANLSEVPVMELNGSGCCYELAYNRMTPFLKWAKQRNVKYWDGMGMLVEQAAEAFFVWHGVYPETDPVLCHSRL